LFISEVARRSGVPAKTLRYYEDIRLLDAPNRSESGYRKYDEGILARLAFIRSAQAIGLSLGEIRSIVALRDGGESPCGHVLELLSQRSAEIDRTIRDLRGLKGELNRLVERAQELDPTECDPSRVCHLIGGI
jgi:DNA-binding transcriptional MerR regulator